jgi:hypothetical protein
MGLKADQKDYYESELQRRVLFIPNLSIFLAKLNDQVLRLPHEMQDPNTNYPTGCTEDDIVKSIKRGVDVVYVMIAPARYLLSTEKDKLLEFKPTDENAYEKMDTFDKAMEKLQWIYLCLEDADWLNDRLVNETLPGDEDVYDYGGEIDGKADITGNLPAPVSPPDDKTLGSVETKNRQSLA